MTTDYYGPIWRRAQSAGQALEREIDRVSRHGAEVRLGPGNDDPGLRAAFALYQAARDRLYSSPA